MEPGRVLPIEDEPVGISVHEEEPVSTVHPGPTPILENGDPHGTGPTPDEHGADEALTTTLLPSDGEDDQPPHDDAWVDAVVKCGCYSSTDAHYDNFSTFEEKINKSLEKLPPQQKQYERISVLMVRWEKSDVPSLALNFEALEKLLGSDGYGFEVDPYVLKNTTGQSNNSIWKAFDTKLTETINDIEEQDNKNKNNLLILYYIGHGAEIKDPDESIETVWQPAEKSSTHLRWKEFQSKLRNANCDVLFLFDCCCALAMIDRGKPWQRRCEIFCASGAIDKASALRKSSFTIAITKELEKRKTSKGIDVLWFHILMTSPEMAREYNLSPAPQWFRFSNIAFQTSILIESKNRQITGAVTPLDDRDSGIVIEESIERLNALSDTCVLVKLRLTNAAELLLHDEWMKWFQQRPNNIARIQLAIVKKIRCIGLFESDSSLLLLTVPIFVWEHIQSDPACQSIGVVRSPNLLPQYMEPEIIPLVVKSQHGLDLMQKERLIYNREKIAETKERAIAETDQAVALREQAAEEREQRAVEREQEVAERNTLVVEKEMLAALEEDRRKLAAAERDKLVAEKEMSAAQEARQRELAAAEREKAVAEMERVAIADSALNARIADRREVALSAKETAAADEAAWRIRIADQREMDLAERERLLAQRERSLVVNSQATYLSRSSRLVEPLGKTSKTAAGGQLIGHAKVTINLPSWVDRVLRTVPDGSVDSLVSRRTRGLDSSLPAL